MASHRLDQDPIPSKVETIIFSYNRAMQLDAVLSSLILHCCDLDSANITVLYKFSDERYDAQYKTLTKDYPFVTFTKQGDFRNDVINWLFSTIPDTQVKNFRSFFSLFNLSRQSVIFRILFNRFIRQLILKLLPCKTNEIFLFLVDDNLFTHDFSLLEVSRHLYTQQKALGFSLRLGKNTNYCYAHDSEQSLPNFINLDDRVLKYSWPGTEHDFSYPFEISSSLYRAKQIIPLLMRIPFSNPNTLEGVIASMALEYAKKLPCLLCFEESVTFCNPINIVQTNEKNRSGKESNYSVESLAQLFDSGKRIDVKAFDKFVPNGCHQEVVMSFFKKK